jgi:hypothetical protein
MHLREVACDIPHVAISGANLRERFAVGGNAQFMERSFNLKGYYAAWYVGVTAGNATCGLQGNWSERLRIPPPPPASLDQVGGNKTRRGNVNRRQYCHRTSQDASLTAANRYATISGPAQGQSDQSVRGATLTACQGCPDCLIACLLNLSITRTYSFSHGDTYKAWALCGSCSTLLTFRLCSASPLSR